MSSKISALTAVSAPALTDIFPVVQGGVTKRETLAQAQAAMAATAANAKDTTNTSTLLTPANLLDVGAVRILWYKTGCDLNSTADQQLTKNGTFTNFLLVAGAFRIVNVTASAASVVGGIYTGASKSGTQVMLGTTAWTSVNGAGGGSFNAGSVAGLALLSASALYLSLTTGQGSAVTGDLYVLGIPLP